MRIGTVPDRPRLRRLLAVLGPGIYGGSVLVLAVAAGWVVAAVVGQHREELVRVSPRDVPAGWPPAAAVLVGLAVGALGLLLARAVGRRPSARRRSGPVADPGVAPEVGEEADVEAPVAEPAEAAEPGEEAEVEAPVAEPAEAAVPGEGAEPDEDAVPDAASVTGVEAAEVVGDVGSSDEVSSDPAGRPAMAGVAAPPPTPGWGEDPAHAYPGGSAGQPGPASGAPVRLPSDVPAPPGGPLSLPEDHEEGPLVLFDRRLTRRVEYDAPARLQWDGHDLAGRVVDVALGGAQLRLSGTSTGTTPPAPSIGTTIRVTVRLEGTPAVVSGTVVWARRDHPDRLLGVQWFGLSAEPEELLRRIVLGTPAA